jgi:hypothetical protein
MAGTFTVEFLSRGSGVGDTMLLAGEREREVD